MGSVSLLLVSILQNYIVNCSSNLSFFFFAFLLLALITIDRFNTDPSRHWTLSLKKSGTLDGQSRYWIHARRRQSLEVSQVSTSTSAARTLLLSSIVSTLSITIIYASCQILPALRLVVFLSSMKSTS